VVNGTLAATGATVNQAGAGYTPISLTVNSGGHLIASGSSFALTQMTLNAGSVFNPGDLSNDAFNLPLYLPAADVALLSAAGGGSDNKSFQDIDIPGGTLASGQTLALNAIGTVSTANLRYVFPGGFTVAVGATLNVGANVAVLLQASQTLTVNGTMTLASGDTLTLSSNYNGGTQVVVNGTLAATGATVNQAGAGYTPITLTVNSGGHLIASGSTFALTQMTLNPGSVFNPGDLANDAFNLPLYLPAADVALLSAAGGGSDNKTFQDIDIPGGTLASGQTLALNAIGTVSTANLRLRLPRRLHGGQRGDAQRRRQRAGAAASQPDIDGQWDHDARLRGHAHAQLQLQRRHTGRGQRLSDGHRVHRQPGRSGLHAHHAHGQQRRPPDRQRQHFRPHPDDAQRRFRLQPRRPVQRRLQPAAVSARCRRAAAVRRWGRQRQQELPGHRHPGGTLASGQTLALNAIGTVSTANLRYVFPGGFTVASGATLNVGANVPVLLQASQTLTVNGTMTLASGTRSRSAPTTTAAHRSWSRLSDGHRVHRQPGRERATRPSRSRSTAAAT